jgi:bifunctional UDP-N-acetylglucosamine pyrophosphorylase/glucosamine-1-phosphate N-acetyltransferase
MNIIKTNNLGVLILAAGKGTRMKSALPKVLHTILDTPMITYVLNAAAGLKPKAIGLVTGMGSSKVKNTVLENLNGIKTPVTFIEQKKLTGSGRAVLEAKNFVKKHRHILILCGDAPLIETKTLKNMFAKYLQTKAAAVVLTCQQNNPFGYGRIIKDKQHNLIQIIEQTETDKETAKITEINSGTYIFQTKVLLSVLNKLKPKGPKKEFYLTDTVEFINNKGGKIITHKISDCIQTMGINSRLQLADALKAMQLKINKKHSAAGVTIVNTETTYINAQTKIGADTVIYPNVFIKGKTVIGSNVTIESNCYLENCTVGDNALIKSGCYIEHSKILRDCIIGPYAHIRPDCVIGPKVKFGNFCEAKKSVISAGSKVPHLSYIGDTYIGKKVNIGAGTITCNYDGKTKSKTIIKDGAFVGSNVNFIAPVKVNRRAVIGAGSTITEEVPANTLAIARMRQTTKKRRKS